MLMGAGAFTSPFEYREVMMALVGYSDKTVDQVQAEQDARHKERDKAAKAGTSHAPRVGTGVQPRQSELDKMRAMLAVAKPRPEAANLVNLDEPPAPE